MPIDLLLDFTRRYQESHRHFHTLERIAAMLHEGRRFPLDEEQVMAIWFHDVVHDPDSDQNQMDSARLAARTLVDLGWEPEAANRVCRIVIDLRSHTPSSPQSMPVLDLALMSLAVPWPMFEANTQAIRAEHANLSDDDFAARRRAWFRHLLARERLFYTPWGQTLEATARKNLERATAAAIPALR